MKSRQLKTIFVAVAAAAAMLSGAVVLSDEGGGVGKGQMGPSGEHGKRGDQSVGGSGQGQGGPSSDSDAKGPRYGGGGAAPAPGDQGGRPAWAGGAVPEDVELGRLNVARSPSHVLDRALAEALATIDPALYTLPTLQAVIDSILAGTAVRIDSPLQNLALYKDLLTDAQIGDGTQIPVSADNYLLLAAIFVGGASDKTLAVTVDTVNALNTIMGLTLPSTITVDQLAAAADAVRTAILTEHE